MALSDEHRKERLTLTRESAAALLEDIVYIREMLGRRGGPSRSELRRLSGILRRILVERDLASVAAPRIRRIKLIEPNNKPFVKLSQRFPFSVFVSGGPTLFGTTIRAFGMLNTMISDADERLFADPVIHQDVEVRLDSFLTQRVLCLDNIWVSRSDVIKYIANVASGIHSKTPTEPAHLLLTRLRRCVRYRNQGGIQIDLSRINDPTPPFRYDPEEIDVVLFELLVAATLVIDSPDVLRLEAAISKELKGFD